MLTALHPDNKMQEHAPEMKRNGNDFVSGESRQLSWGKCSQSTDRHNRTTGSGRDWQHNQGSLGGSKRSQRMHKRTLRRASLNVPRNKVEW